MFPHIGLEATLHNDFPLTIWWRRSKYQVRNPRHESEGSEDHPEIFRFEKFSEVVECLRHLSLSGYLRGVKSVTIDDMESEQLNDSDNDQDSDQDSD